MATLCVAQGADARRLVHSAWLVWWRRMPNCQESRRLYGAQTQSMDDALQATMDGTPAVPVVVPPALPEDDLDVIENKLLQQVQHESRKAEADALEQALRQSEAEVRCPAGLLPSWHRLPSVRAVDGLVASAAALATTQVDEDALLANMLRESAAEAARLEELELHRALARSFE